MENFKFFEDNSISYQKFLSVFYGIKGDNIFNSNLTHTDLIEIFPYLERASFAEALSDIRLVLTGKIVIVKDFKGTFLPYKVPLKEIEKYIEENEKIDDFEITYQNYFKQIYQDVIYNPDTKLYELQQLAHKLKKMKYYKESKKVCKVLKEKKDPNVIKYKQKKIKLCMEGMDDYYD